MFCSKCGNAMPDGSRFCSSCGATAEPAQPIQQNFFQAAPDLSEEEVTASPCAEQEIFETPTSSVPAEPAPVYQMPLYQQSAQESCDDEYAAREEAPKGRKKMKFILLGIAASVVLALLAGVIVFLLVYNSPKAKLFRAVKKNGADLTEVFEESKHFSKAVDNARKLGEEKKYTTKVEYKIDSTSELYGFTMTSENKISLLYNYNLENKQLSGTLSVDSGISYTEKLKYDVGYDFEIYGDSEMLAISMPGTLSDTYSVPVDDLGYEIFDSQLGQLLEDSLDEETVEMLRQLDVDLFADTSWQAYREAYPNLAENFTDSLDIAKSDYSIPYASNPMKVYSLTWDNWAFEEMAVSYMLFAMDGRFGQGFSGKLGDYEESLREKLDELTESNLQVYAGIYRGKLTALHIETDDEKTTILWEGSENIWETVRIYDGDKEQFAGGVSENADGFTLWAEAAGEKYSVVCRDSAGELTVNTDGESFIVRYGHANDGIQLWFDYEKEDYDISVSVDFHTFEQIQKPASTIDILTLSMEELEALGEKIKKSLLTN